MLGLVEFFLDVLWDCDFMPNLALGLFGFCIVFTYNDFGCCFNGLRAIVLGLASGLRIRVLSL